MREHDRKKIRLADQDYSENECYFLTVCVKEKHCVFGRVGDGVLDVPMDGSTGISLIDLSEVGVMVHEQIMEMSAQYRGVHVDHFVIMPNHIHLLLSVADAEKGEQGTSRTPSPTNAKIPQFISYLKRATNKKAGFDLWQRSYYDHVIRDAEDYWYHWRYIDQNPLRWADDEYHYR